MPIFTLRNNFSALLFFVCCYVTNAQSIVKGKLQNSQQQSLGYASISLHKSLDSTLIKGSLSDSLGNFAFENVAIGNYLIAVSSVTVPRVFISNIKVTDSLKTYSVENLIITETIKQLDEIKVTAKKPLIEKRIDKLIANIDGSALAKGNNGLEVLRYIPTVKVDNKGEIAVMGKKGTAIYIDSKPQNDPSNDLLKSMRAESIERIEVYSNPPAKFDAAGSSVINIITKKDKMFSSISQEFSTPFYPTKNISGLQYISSFTSLTLYNKFGKLKTKTTVGSSIDNDNFSKSGSELLYKLTGVERTNIYSQNAHVPTFRIGVAADYDFNDKNSLIVEYTYRKRSNFFNNINDYKYFTKAESIVDSTFLSENNSKSKSSNNRLYAGFVHKINNKGQQLSLGYQLISSESINENNYQNSTNNIPTFAETTPTNNQLINAFNLNVELPTSEGYQWEFGSKYTNLDFASTFNWFNINKGNKIEDTNFRNDFMFNESIWATFVSTSKTFGKWQLNTGLRNEYTSSKGNTDGTILRKEYNNLFPSIFLQYSIADEKQIGVSYTKRVQRPFYGEFNLKGIPFFDSPLNIIKGNSNLSPQFIHALEANYLYKDFYIALSLNRTNERRITLPVLTEGNRIVSQVFNLAYSDNFVLAISKPFTITKWWQTTNNATFYRHQSKLLDNSIINGNYWDANSQHTFTLSKTASIEASLQYYSGEIEQYTKSGIMKRVDVGFKNSFYKNKLELNVSVNDIFGIMKFINISDFPLTYEYSKSISNQRSVRISLTYKFPTTSKFQKKGGKTNDFGEVR